MKTKELKIMDELRDLIPPLGQDELEQLHRSIDATSGPETPLKVWKGKGVLIDGHHRYAYCMDKGYDFDIQYMSFLNINAVKDYMILNQLGRRNLDPRAASLLRGQLYSARKLTQGGDRKSKGQSDLLKNTAQTVAKQTGVSEETIKRDAKFADAVDAIKDMVKSGKITLEEKETIMSKPKREIIKTAKSPQEVLNEKPKKKVAPSEKVIAAFKRLPYEQQCLAIEEIHNYWENL